MTTNENPNQPSGHQEADQAGPDTKQHGDPLLSTTHGKPEEGSRHGEAPPATGGGQTAG